MTSYIVDDDPKMLRETLCVAQAAIGNGPVGGSRRREHIERLERLIDECDRHRPIGTDGKHGDKHTATCGCDGVRSCRRGDPHQSHDWYWRPLTGKPGSIPGTQGITEDKMFCPGRVEWEDQEVR